MYWALTKTMESEQAWNDLIAVDFYPFYPVVGQTLILATPSVNLE